ncbi:MAG: hypothetical protein HFE63_10560 [Clostridiales bacterium]|nr:hypothetical protein [Clostridiales bacterium]
MIIACFGHGDTPSSVSERLEREMVRLIEENDEIEFLVGTHGSFDGMVQKILKSLAPRYPKMKYTVVLAYLPVKAEDIEYPTILPEGIEKVPKRFAINFRNNYMVDACDGVLCYITHDWGGAAKFVQRAERKKKKITNIYC